MTKKIERTVNSYDDVNAPLGITLNTTTYTQVLEENIERIGYKISNITNHDILVLEKVPPDNNDRGFAVYKKSIYESKPDNTPRGEIYAKSLTGSPSILITEE